MRPTNDERREVAASLREFEQLRAVFKDSSICAFSDALGVGYMDWEHICARLADLIEPEERTCHLRYDTVHNDMVCSSCGAWIDMVAYSELETSGIMHYCPFCGAKVVEE